MPPMSVRRSVRHSRLDCVVSKRLNRSGVFFHTEASAYLSYYTKCWCRQRLSFFVDRRKCCQLRSTDDCLKFVTLSVYLSLQHCCQCTLRWATQPNPTQPNPTHGSTQPMDNSGVGAKGGCHSRSRRPMSVNTARTSAEYKTFDTRLDGHTERKCVPKITG